MFWEDNTNLLETAIETDKIFQYHIVLMIKLSYYKQSKRG